MDRKSKSVEELTFTDNGMFQAVLREPKICAELVERLLGIQVGRVEYPELEKQIAPFYTTKGVRLDVYLKDSGKIIDVEMQVRPQNALGKRTRYYQSMLDIDALMKGENYESLKESYVLFICKRDPFKDRNNKPYGLSRYTFRNICTENNLVNLDDKSLKVVYNASAYETEKDEKIRNLLRFIQTDEPGDDEFSRRLSAIVRNIKENEQFKREYAAMNLHDWDLIKETRVEAAMNFAANGVSHEIIARSLNLPLEEVDELAKGSQAEQQGG